MRSKTLTVSRLKCKRCGYDWQTRTPAKPRQCPHCKSPKWDTERKTSREEK